MAASVISGDELEPVSPPVRSKVVGSLGPSEREFSEIKAIFAKCNPEDSTSDGEKFEVQPGSIFWMLQEDEHVVAFLVLQNLCEFRDSPSFTEEGGLRNREGYFVSCVCKDPDSLRVGVAKILLDDVAFYMPVNYMLLHADVNKPYLVKVYTRAGFAQVGILPAGKLYDVDTVIFRRTL